MAPLSRARDNVGPTGATGPSYEGATRPAYVSTSWYGPPAVSHAGSTGTLTNGTARYIPIYISKAVSMDRLAFWLVTNGTSGAKIRMAVYNTYRPFSTPQTVLVDTGQVAADSGASALKTFTLSPALALVPGWYFIAIAAQGGVTSGNLQLANGVVAHPPLPYDATSALQATGCYGGTGVTGAWHDSPSITLGSGTLAPAVIWRAA